MSGARNTDAVVMRSIEQRTHVRVRYELFPPGNRKVLEALMRWASRVIPSWVDDLLIQEAELDEGETARVHPQREYRSASILIASRFFDPRKSDADLAAVLLHELMHLVIDPVHEAAHGVMNMAVDAAEGDPLYKMVREAVRVGVETTTSDLTALLFPMLGPVPELKR